jgi:hypothetical protein
MGKNTRVVFTIVLAFLILTPFVFGANALDNIFNNPMLKGINIAATYQNNFAFIDAILYFILFIGVASTALGERFKESKTVPTIIGVMLAIGMAVFEYQTKFNLGKLAPFAALVFFLIFGMAVYSYTRSFSESKIVPFALAVVTLITLINWFAPSLKAWILRSPAASAIWMIGGLVAWIGLIIVVYRNIRIKLDMNTHIPSRDTSDERTYTPNIKDGIDSIRGAERDVEREATDDTEKYMAKGGEKIEDLEEGQNIVDVEADKFADQLKKLKTTETKAEDLETNMLNALSNYSENTNAKLKEIQNGKYIDQPAKEFLKANLQGMAQLCMHISNNQGIVLQSRKEFLDETQKDFKKMTDVIAKCKHIDKGLKDIEEDMKKSLKYDIIEKVEKHIENEIKNIEKLEHKANSKDMMTTDTSPLEAQQQGLIVNQIIKLKEQIPEKQKVLEAIKATKAEIDNLATEIGKATNIIREVLKRMESAQKNVNNDATEAVAFIKTYDISIDNMKRGSEAFSTNVKKLSSQEITITSLETIPIQANMDIGKVFNEMIAANKKTIVFYSEKLKKLIDDVKIVVGNDAEITRLITTLKKDLMKINNSYVGIKESADQIIGKPQRADASSRRRLQNIMNKATEIEAKDAIERNKIINEAINKLDAIENITIPTEVQNIKAENDKIITSGTNISNQLTNALDVIIKNKSRLDTEFMRKAENLTQNVDTAVKNMRDVRAKA